MGLTISTQEKSDHLMLWTITNDVFQLKIIGLTCHAIMQKKNFALTEPYISDRTCIFSLHSLEAKYFPLPQFKAALSVTRSTEVSAEPQDKLWMWQICSEHQHLPTKLYSVCSEDGVLKITADSYCGKGNTDERNKGGDLWCHDVCIVDNPWSLRRWSWTCALFQVIFGEANFSKLKTNIMNRLIDILPWDVTCFMINYSLGLVSCSPAGMSEIFPKS